MSPEEPRGEQPQTNQSKDHSVPGLPVSSPVLRMPATWAEAPDGLADGVLEAIHGGAGTGTTSRHRQSRWLPAAVAALVVASVAMFIGLTGGTSNTGDAPLVAAVEATDMAPDIAGTVSIRPTGSGWWIKLEVSRLEPAPPGAYYEGWVWSSGEGVSIGTFHMRGGDEPVILWSGVDLGEYTGLSVTLQQEGDGHAPSDDVVLRANLAIQPG